MNWTKNTISIEKNVEKPTHSNKIDTECIFILKTKQKLKNTIVIQLKHGKWVLLSLVTLVIKSLSILILRF